MMRFRCLRLAVLAASVLSSAAFRQRDDDDEASLATGLPAAEAEPKTRGVEVSPQARLPGQAEAASPKAAELTVQPPAPVVENVPVPKGVISVMESSPSADVDLGPTKDILGKMAVIQEANGTAADAVAKGASKVAGDASQSNAQAATAAEQTASSNAFVAYFKQTPYHELMAPMLALTVSLAILARPTTDESMPEGFAWYQFSYLVVWAFCVAGDWLQGPYVFALYAAYGFSIPEIAQLFVAGFGSSLVFGCFVGSFIDYFGRKRSCIAYCILYILSCVTKHYNDYSILMVGRLLGGICTSLLFSCFECWLVAEHLEVRKFSGQLLSYMFGMMFSMMYFVAIATGIIAESISRNFPFQPISPGSIVYTGGFCVPFDLAIGTLLVGMVLIMAWWGENYGASTSDENFSDSFLKAGRLLVTDFRMMLLCVIVACYESSMYAFVFHWTPALESKVVKPPHGVIFSLFMMACMCGASGSTIISRTVSPLPQLLAVMLLGIVSFGTLTQSAATSTTSREALLRTFLAFMAFEFCVGIYFPNVGMLKSEIVPENVRGVMYNIFRLPLNALVLVLLLGEVPMVTCFQLCMGLCMASFASVLAVRVLSKPDEEALRPPC
eukprot:TRINITY_DN10241_c0_g2_i1.p1 TRINITY_DN10241_c0_g2~~TRINITY_DN10241_c0_g2_i1.p1  ORF type:complete len:612 (-),score=149.29 TRINITY_DN10241_c0_g2_i1:70-1905(-)